MKNILLFVLVVSLMLSLVACDGTTGRNDEPPSHSAPFSSQESTSNQTANPVSTSAGTPVDGDFLYISLGGAEPVRPGMQITGGLDRADVVFLGDTSDTEYLDVTELTIYINGEPQASNASNVTYEAGRYYWDGNVTLYSINFYGFIPPDTPPIPQQTAKIWIEAVINGSRVRMETHDWQEDGSMIRSDDASIDKRLSLAAGASAPSSMRDAEIIQLGGMDWRILDIQDGKALVLSEYLVNSGPIHPDDGEPPSWETSNLRKYLNTEFYDKFSDEEKSRIIETPGISSYNPWHDRTVGNVTTDKIFILSAEEVIKYMLDDSGEVIEENGNYSYEAPGIDSILSARFEDGQHYAWWLRTVGKGDVATQQGSDAQDFISVGVHSSRLILSGDRLSTDPSCCVRPAMWITIDGSPAPTTPGATPTPAQLERIGRWDVALTLSLSGYSLEHSGIYSGDILNGLPHGQGSFTTQNTFDRKRVYTGEWNAGHLQGEGSLEHNNRLKFEGIFENDLMVSGKMYDLSGQLYYEGDFRDGLRIEDAAALQARINAYDADAIFLSGSFSYDWNYSIGESFSQDGGFEQYVGQIVAMEHEFFDIVPDGAGVAVTIRQLSPVGYTVANYYPAYEETFPQTGSKIRCYYRVYEDNGMVYRDLVAWTSI